MNFAIIKAPLEDYLNELDRLAELITSYDLEGERNRELKLIDRKRLTIVQALKELEQWESRATS